MCDIRINIFRYFLDEKAFVMCVILMTLVTYTILPFNGPSSWYLPFSKWVASRIGVRRVSFNAYSKDQLKTILAWEPGTDSQRTKRRLALRRKDYVLSVISCNIYAY